MPLIPDDVWGELVEAASVGLVDCEACDAGIAYSTGKVCRACGGSGMREP